MTVEAAGTAVTKTGRRTERDEFIYSLLEAIWLHRQMLDPTDEEKMTHF